MSDGDRRPFQVVTTAKPADRLPAAAEGLKHVGMGTTRAGVPFNVWVYVAGGSYPTLHVILHDGADGLSARGWRVGLSSLVHALLEHDPADGTSTPIEALRGMLAAMPAGDVSVLDVVGPAVDALAALIDALPTGDPPPG